MLSRSGFFDLERRAEGHRACARRSYELGRLPHDHWKLLWSYGRRDTPRVIRGEVAGSMLWRRPDSSAGTGVRGHDLQGSRRDRALRRGAPSRLFLPESGHANRHSWKAIYKLCLCHCDVDATQGLMISLSFAFSESLLRDRAMCRGRATRKFRRLEREQ